KSHLYSFIRLLLFHKAVIFFTSCYVLRKFLIHQNPNLYAMSLQRSFTIIFQCAMLFAKPSCRTFNVQYPVCAELPIIATQEAITHDIPKIILVKNTNGLNNSFGNIFSKRLIV